MHVNCTYVFMGRKSIENERYIFSQFHAGGDLFDAFQKGGQLSVEALVREQFGIFMYNNGKGQIINRAEFLRWKYMDNKEVVIPIEASLSSHDPLGKWQDHKACWQMQYRGSLGESLLHVRSFVTQKSIRNWPEFYCAYFRCWPLM